MKTLENIVWLIAWCLLVFCLCIDHTKSVTDELFILSLIVFLIAYWIHVHNKLKEHERETKA
jgi:hypothetical protein